MRDYIVKKDTALVLFAIQNLNLKCDYRNFLLWNKFIESFHYDDEVVCSLVFIEYPMEFYIGVSVRSNDPALLEKKIKRYSEGLAYLLIYHFPEAYIRVLGKDECLSVVINTVNLLTNDIPENLVLLNGITIPRKILFTRAIDPKITFDKLFEFYEKYYREKQSSIEKRMGVKPVYDKRILDVLQHPILAYSFKIFPSRVQLEAELQEDNVCEMPEENFVDKFLDTMSVPDDLVGLVYKAESVSDLFDNPYVSLVSPKSVVELILS
jgi:hypothetical protein